jgi:serine/threonine-protein kinase
LPWREAAQIGRDACAGLLAAAAVGIVHRDVKPANLFVTDAGAPGDGQKDGDRRPRAKLTDFGLAREVKGSSSVTQQGMVVGTPAYLAPEVIRGQPATHASDIYSLGATLYHLVCGRPPFSGDAPLEMLAAALKDEIVPAHHLAPETPRALSELLSRSLSREPALRPASFSTFDEALARLLEGAGPQGTARFPSRGAQADGLREATTGPVVQRTLTMGSAPVLAAAPALVEGINRAPSLVDGASAPQTPSSPSRAAFSSRVLGTAVFVSGEQPSLRIKTKSLAVMLTDIAGYAERTSRQSRDESARWLGLHDALLQPVFRAFGGRVVKTLGDAFLVTFASPTDAALCGCAVQDRLWQHNARAPADESISVRIAITAGEVRLHKGDVYGEPVNVAARLEPLAQPGEVLLSDAVFATMNAAEVPLERHGEHTLKGISRPIVVYRVTPDRASSSDGRAPGPPFGGRALQRVKTSAFDTTTREIARAARKVPTAAWASLVVLGLAIAVALVLWPESRRDRIEAGLAKAVIDEIEAIPAEDRDADDLFDLGFALQAQKSSAKAFKAFRGAVEKGGRDPAALDVLFEALGAKDHDGAIDVLAAWPDPEIEGRLRDALGDDRWWPRHHALAALEQRKAATEGDRIALGLKDITSDDCSERRYGLMLLKKHGKGDDVLRAVEALGSDVPRNLCLALDVGPAKDAIRKRSAG